MAARYDLRRTSGLLPLVRHAAGGYGDPLNPASDGACPTTPPKNCHLRSHSNPVQTRAHGRCWWHCKQWITHGKGAPASPIRTRTAAPGAGHPRIKVPYPAVYFTLPGPLRPALSSRPRGRPDFDERGSIPGPCRRAAIAGGRYAAWRRRSRDGNDIGRLRNTKMQGPPSALTPGWKDTSSGVQRAAIPWELTGGLSRFQTQARSSRGRLAGSPPGALSDPTPPLSARSPPRPIELVKQRLLLQQDAQYDIDLANAVPFPDGGGCNR